MSGLLNDAMEIDSLFNKKSNDYQLHTYNKSEYEYITDTQSNATSLFFDNQTAMQKLGTLHDAFLEVPLTCTITGSVNTNWLKDFAFKGCAADIFTNINFTLANGQPIVNEQNSLPLINHVRRLTRFNDLGLKQKGPEFQYAPDRYPNTDSVFKHDGASLGVARAPPSGKGLNSTVKQFTRSYATGTASQPANSTTVTGAGGAAWEDAALDNTGAIIVWADGTIDTVITCDTATTLTVATKRNSSIAAGTGYTLYFNAAMTNAVTLAAPIDNPFYNEGLVKRIAYRKENTEFKAADTFTLHCIIPLAEIHEIFQVIDFPLTNVRFQLRLDFSAPINSSSIYNCLIASLNGTTAGTHIPTMTFSPGAGNARLYYKNVTLEPSDNAALQASISSGISKSLVYTETRWYSVATNVNSNFGGVRNYTISPSETNVQRIIVFALPTGALTSTSLTLNPTVRFDRVALKINNNPDRMNLLSTTSSYPIEQWKILSEQTHSGGMSDVNCALLDYHVYQKNIGNYYIFDMERKGIRPDKRSPVQLSIELTERGEGDMVAYDLYALIETEARLALNFNTNSCTIIKSYA